MAIIIDSASDEQIAGLNAYQAFQLYNAIDCCVTAEIFSKRQMDRCAEMTYLNAKDKQAMCLEMQLRGIKMNEAKAYEEVQILTREIAHLTQYFDEICLAIADRTVNVNSPQQLLNLFKGFGFKIQSTERDTLEKLMIEFYAEPIVRVILAIRDKAKLRNVIAKSKRSRTGRFHASFKVAGTSTGRLSSSKDPFGEGHNLQNITDRTRRVFIADPGKKLAYIDLEQAESRAVAYLSDDPAYIKACESGDLHTLVCQMVWEDLEWTGELPKDKAVAETPFYRWFTYRDMAKRGGHGTNYYGKPFTMAKHLKIAKSVMEDFQNRYFAAFPGIRKWHYRVMKNLMTDGWLMTPFGRKRGFFGRHNDDSTIRKAIAFEPQSLVGDIINEGIDRVRAIPGVEILAQVHDAVLFQYPADQETTIIPDACARLQVPVRVFDKTLIIPVEPKVGWNWGQHDPHTNPHGIKKWTGQDDRSEPRYDDFALLDTTMA